MRCHLVILLFAIFLTLSPNFCSESENGTETATLEGIERKDVVAVALPYMLTASYASFIACSFSNDLPTAVIDALPGIFSLYIILTNNDISKDFKIIQIFAYLTTFSILSVYAALSTLRVFIADRAYSEGLRVILYILSANVISNSWGKISIFFKGNSGESVQFLITKCAEVTSLLDLLVKILPVPAAIIQTWKAFNDVK
jgi:hypothetical protein